MIKFLSILILLTSAALSFEYEEKTRLEVFLENFYSKPGYVLNKPMLRAEFGIDHFGMNGIPQPVQFKRNYAFGFYYGFLRKDTAVNGFNYFYQDSEYAFIENISSTFKNFKNTTPGIHTDTWKFGLGFEDGFGKKFSEDHSFTMLHSTAFSWSHIDFDIQRDILESEPKFDQIRRFDEQIRFGGVYRGGIRLSTGEYLSIDLLYQKSLVYPHFDLPKWGGAYLFDNLVQRWIDYFEPDFIFMFGENYPLLKFVYKNTASFLIYKLRENSMYYPFDSKPPFYFNSYKVSLTFVF